MIFDRGGFSLAKNLPNGLKVSLELFRVRDFNRVDRVERVEMIGVGKGASHLNLNSGTCKTCGTGKTDDCLNLTGGACENPAMLNSANCSNLLSCASHLSYSSQGVRSTLHSHLLLLISHLSSPITNQQAKPFIRRGTLR